MYSAALAVGILDREQHATLGAIVILSMALTPLCVALLRLLPRSEESMDGVERADGLGGNVLLIGFGRFGQVVSQGLLARGVDVSIIDPDVEMIRAAADFGFKVYYGDGTRLDVLHACGAGKAQAIAVCVDNKHSVNKIVEVVRAEFPLVRLLVRSYDREHSLELIAARVDYQIRETFESAVSFGEAALIELGVPRAEAAEIAVDVRRRDAERLQLELAGGLAAGASLMRGNAPKPTPFTQPVRESRALSEETALVTRVNEENPAT